MSWKDLYSEVKKRKLQALNKKDVVKAVEKHGKILAVEGKFEKPKKVISNMYAAEKKIIKPKHVKKTDLKHYDVVLIGCPGKEIPISDHPKIKEFVKQGGWLITTDWAIVYIIEYIFFGYIRWNQKRTDEDVVACQIIEPDHPFLDSVISEIQQSKWQKSTSKSTKKKEFRWWLENRSFPIYVVNPQAVRVLISSNELKKKWGAAPVLLYFDYGKAGGRVIHMISHTHLQKGDEKGKYASALILTNILDEKISQKLGISKKPTEGYVSNWEIPTTEPTSPSSQIPLEDQWIMPSQDSNYVTPDLSNNQVGFSETSQIKEIDPSKISPDRICVFCKNNFSSVSGKVYECSECHAPYHEECLNKQINQGICSKCNRILLW